MDVKRTGIILEPSNARVVIRPFQPPGEERVMKIIARVLSLSEPEVDRLISDVMREFLGRHQVTRAFFLRRFTQVKQHVLTDHELSENRRLLIGSYFSQEYALESAALFNPSMVWHPDQSGLSAGERRFILSLRATGEGHISSITFRSGVIDGDNTIRIDKPTRFGQLHDRLAIPAAHDAEVREEGQTDQAVCPAAHDSRVDRLEFAVRNPVEDRPGSRLPAWQRRETCPTFTWSFRHPHQQDDLAGHEGGSRVEDADNLERIVRRSKVLRAQQHRCPPA